MDENLEKYSDNELKKRIMCLAYGGGGYSSNEETQAEIDRLQDERERRFLSEQ